MHHRETQRVHKLSKLWKLPKRLHHLRNVYNNYLNVFTNFKSTTQTIQTTAPTSISTNNTIDLSKELQRLYFLNDNNNELSKFRNSARFRFRYYMYLGEIKQMQELSLDRTICQTAGKMTAYRRKHGQTVHIQIPRPDFPMEPKTVFNLQIIKRSTLF